MRSGQLRYSSSVNAIEITYRYTFDLQYIEWDSIVSIVHKVLGLNAIVGVEGILVSIPKDNEKLYRLKFLIVDSCISYVINKGLLKLDELAIKYLKELELVDKQ